MTTSGARPALEDIFPLSPVQAGMLFQLLDQPGGVFMGQLACELRGRLDPAAFARAWQRAVDRHPVLRAGIAWEGLRQPQHVICRDVRAPVDLLDWRDRPLAGHPAALDRLLRERRERRPDLRRPPLLTLVLVRLEDARWHLVWTYPQLLLDGWSVSALLREVLETAAGWAQRPPAPPFKGYIRRLLARDRAPAREFWRTALAGFAAPTLLDLPPDPPGANSPTPAAPTPDARANSPTPATSSPDTRANSPAPAAPSQDARTNSPAPAAPPHDPSANSPAPSPDTRANSLGAPEILFSDADTRALRAGAAASGCTLGTLIHAAFGLTLALYGDSDDVLFATMASDRPPAAPGAPETLGHMLQTLPVRLRLRPGDRVGPWLRALQDSLLAAREHGHLALGEMQDFSAVPRGQPLFEALLSYENYPGGIWTDDHGPRPVVPAAVQFIEDTGLPLTLLAVPLPALVLRLVHRTDRIAHAAAARLLEQLRHTLRALADGPDRPLAAALTLPPAHQAALWPIGGLPPDPPPAFVPDRLAFHAARSPDATAVLAPGDADGEPLRLTYAALARRVDALAARLLAHGCRPGDRVGILLDRSAALVVALLAVMRAGAVCLPFTRELPRPRLARLLADVGARLLVVDPARDPDLPGDGLTRVDLDLTRDDPGSADLRDRPPLAAHDIAYVLHTSGSTGAPKGVACTHGGLATALDATATALGLGPGDRTLAVCAVTFDMGLFELLVPLWTGGSVVVAPELGRRDGAWLVRALARWRISFLQATPSALALLSAAAWPGSPGLQILSAGEELTRDLAARLLAGGARLWNAYGPTEATIFATLGEVHPGEVPTIGRPLPGSYGLLLGRRGRPVPPGVPGEYCIGGHTLAHGYLGRPALTAAAFRPCPVGWRPGARVYATGDRARLRDDGRLEFLGRRDHQIKLRGHRIELGEIEAVLAAHPGVAQAAVALDLRHPGQPRLRAWVVPGDLAAPARRAAALAARAPAPPDPWHELPDGREIALPDALLPDPTRAAAHLARELAPALPGGVTLEVGPCPALLGLVADVPGARHLAAATTPAGLGAAARNADLHGLRGATLLLDAPGGLARFLAREAVTALDLVALDLPGRLLDLLAAVPLLGTARRILLTLDPAADPEPDVLAALERAGQRLLRRIPERPRDGAPRWLLTEPRTSAASDPAPDPASARDLAPAPASDPASARDLAPATTSDPAPLPGSVHARTPDPAPLPGSARDLAPAATSDHPGAPSPRWRGRPVLRASLLEHLTRHLPAAAVPADIEFVPRLPLTTSGKVDRRQLLETTAESTATVLTASTDRAAAEQLAALMADVLQRPHVAPHDSFFRLGGDSIQAMLLSARARARGLALTPQQIFSHPTPEELATVLAPAPAPSADPGPITGQAALTPIQEWFFARALPAAHHWNQAMRLRLAAPVPVERLARALADLLDHHDVLRARFVRDGDEWVQRIEPPDPALFDLSQEPPDTRALALVDLSRETPESRPRALADALARAQAGLDLARAPLFRAVLLRGAEPGRDHLLLLAHHLLVDAVSWHILVADLADRLAEPPRPLAPRSAALGRWSDALRRLARTDPERLGRAHWLALAAPLAPDSPAPLAADPPAPLAADPPAPLAPVSGPARSHRARLSLPPGPPLTELAARLGATASELLIAAFAAAWARLTGDPVLTCALESHGRDLDLGLDITRTVGWFTSLCPIRLELAGRSPAAVLDAVRTALREIPAGGHGFELLLRHGDDATRSALQALPAPRVSLNDLGHVADVLDAGPLQWHGDDPGPVRAPGQPRPFALDVEFARAGDVLRLDLHARPDCPLDLDHLARALADDLARLLDHARHLAPAAAPRFPLLPIPEAQLAARLDLAELDDAYPLTPAQAGMLFRALHDERGAVYVNEFRWTLVGPFDPDAFRAAWQHLLDRHPALRTAIHHDGLDQPVQVVHRRALLPWRLDDLRHHPDPPAVLARRSADNLRHGFDLARAPLLRLDVLRLADDRHRVVWCFHHIILDGWCVDLLLDEVFRAYADLAAGRSPAPHPLPPPYRDHVAWLMRQDLGAAEATWRAVLAGFREPTPLPFLRSPAGAPDDTAADTPLVRHPLSRPLADALRDLARRHGLTLNTFAQGLWALLLHHHARRDDILVAATIAGRPADLPGAERMIGLFIHTLVLRCRVDPDAPLLAWLRAIQREQAELRRLPHCSLAQLQRWSDVPGRQPLATSLVLFQNIPQRPRPAPDGAALRVEDEAAFVRNDFPLTLRVLPVDGLELQLLHDPAAFLPADLELLLAQLAALFDAVAADPDRSLRAFLEPLARLTAEHHERARASRRRGLLRALGGPPA